MPPDGLVASIAKMRGAGADDDTIAMFERSYERLRAGDRGLLPEADIEPLDRLAGAGDRSSGDPGPAGSLERVAIVRLNGGLGTTMATSGGKGRLEVKAGLSFVDLARRQVEALRRRTSCTLPLLLMESPATARGAGSGPDRSFLQRLLPRLRADDLQPIDWPADPRLEWAPAGHGDVFHALASSGWLHRLLESGCEYACISSIDNVAFRVDPRLVAAMERDSIPFLMEVATRTAADRKGGHLARRGQGGLVLRELAQTPAEDRGAFQDIGRHRYFNTNTCWVELRALDALLARTGGLLDLPLIANQKPVDPYDECSPEVIQIETAMGSAISVFDDADACHVDRAGFNPVRTTAELLAVRSDAYVLGGDRRLALAGPRGGRAPIVDLDPAFYARQRDFDRRFPEGPPSLLDCDSLLVRGDVVFGRDVVIRGEVAIVHDGPGQRVIAGGTVLEGS